MRRWTSAGLGAAAAAALILSGCAAPAEDTAGDPGVPTAPHDGPDHEPGPEVEPEGPGPDATTGTANLNRTPDPDQDPLPHVDPAGALLPHHLQQRLLVEGPWDVLPQERGGTFLAPRERDGALDFTAVDSTGTVLWAAQRPASCAGFTVTTTADGQDLAILTDLASSEEALAQTTASAYDLHTGEQIWGPVDVGGPHIGPGLVFAAPAGGPMGAHGPAVVLDAGTGEVLIEEDDDVRILGEYDGTVLMVDGEDVVAMDREQEMWRLPDPGWAGGDLAAAPGTRSGEALARLQAGPGAQVVLDLADGSVLSEDALDAGTDEATGAHVVVDQTQARGFDAAGEEQWAAMLTGPTTITGIGGVMVYLRTGDTVRVHNVLTGEVAQAYDPAGEGQILVPAGIAAGGASVVVAAEGYRLVTVTPDGAGQE